MMIRPIDPPTSAPMRLWTDKEELERSTKRMRRQLSRRRKQLDRAEAKVARLEANRSFDGWVQVGLPTTSPWATAGTERHIDLRIDACDATRPVRGAATSASASARAHAAKAAPVAALCAGHRGGRLLALAIAQVNPSREKPGT